MGRIRIFESLEKAHALLPLNRPKRVVFQGEKFCFIRTKNGIKAFSDFCPHQKAFLSEGTITGFNEIVCPLHEYRFNLSHGGESSNRCNSLKFLEIHIDQAGVFLTL